MEVPGPQCQLGTHRRTESAFPSPSVLTQNRARFSTLTQSHLFPRTGSRRLRSMLRTLLQATIICLSHRHLQSSNLVETPRPALRIRLRNTRPSLLLHRTVYPDRKSLVDSLLRRKICPRKSSTHTLSTLRHLQRSSSICCKEAWKKLTAEPFLTSTLGETTWQSWEPVTTPSR